MRKCLAGTAALALALYCASAGAQEIGRLFFTPAERAARDELRLHPPQAAAPVPTPPSVNGVVRRSAGPPTLWLDGIAHDLAGARARGVVLGRRAGEVLWRHGAQLSSLPVGSVPAGRAGSDE
ncbi:MAG: hypothetical protein JNJ60_11145 [Rhodocyclaceae bacterium]|nr:hypothetical protein [Rhodocyclaceae bacterium]